MPPFFTLQIDALSEIVDTVQGRIEVYLDGGIRTGSDVLKSLALGAKCVFIGRPAVWGLAYKVKHLSRVRQCWDPVKCTGLSLCLHVSHPGTSPHSWSPLLLEALFLLKLLNI